ncbi:MAG: FkbM family methyltransferase [Gammaproteobacteria bacterium]|nr:FkbM family methyltransferase [Gammaproteobacteria bacterium]
MNIRRSLKCEKRLQEVIGFLRPIDAGHKLIRVGCQDSDGGYLIPDDFEGIGACFSPGVSKMADFEKDMVKRGISCYLADGTVNKAPISDKSIHFTKKNLAKENSDNKDMSFWQKLFRSKPQEMRLDTWMNQHSYDGDLILQIDIEGYEYEVFDSIGDKTLNKFRIIVAEFHDLGNLLTYQRHSKGSIIHKVFKKLAKNFSVVHIHPNNANPSHLWGEYEVPNLLEVTFLRKDRIHSQKPVKTFPHPLDRDNVNGHPKLVLPKCWYK